MKKNVGKLDGYIRYIIGIGLIITSIVLNFIWWLALIGVVLIATSSFGFCLIYKVLDINTNQENEKRDKDITD